MDTELLNNEMPDEMQPDSASIGQTENAAKPGELYFLLFLLIICMAFLVQAFQYDGIWQGKSGGPGALPQLITAAMALMILGVIFQTCIKRKGNYSIREMAGLLFCPEVLILIGAVVIYGVMLELLHFIAMSFLFLWGTMYLLDRKQLIKKGIISLLTTAVITFIFSFIFRVVLP